MADPQTTNKLLYTPAHNADIDFWDVPVNANWNGLDQALGKYTTLNANGLSGTIALTASQTIPLGFIIQGTPSGSINYQVPAGQGGIWLVRNGATLGASITLGFSSASGGATVNIPASKNLGISADGTANGMANIDTVADLSAGGSNTQVQVNVGGFLAGYAGFIFDGATLDVPNLAVAGSTTLDDVAISGNGTAPTPPPASNNAKLATTAYVDRVAVQQVVVTQTGAVATGSTGIPDNDSIPQNTQGDQFMSATITPKSATSKLVISIVAQVSPNAPGNISMALFQDATVNALAANQVYRNASAWCGPLGFQFEMTSGTTLATTFNVRIGGGAGQTVTFNGIGGGRIFGGVMASSIIIQEIGI